MAIPTDKYIISKREILKDTETKIELIIPMIEHNKAYCGNSSRQMNIDDDVWKH